jgi:hypothetical protein
MGSSSSSMAEAATHGQAFSQTENTRQIMDTLLNYMIKQLSIRDLLQMSNPSECKKYVLFKANSIYQYFYELRIFPTKDSRGILTFRKVDDLVNPKGEKEKERQSLCLIVAYFYTRIFQIYGALALTVIDDMNAMTSSGMMSLPSVTDARLRTPGHYPQSPYYGKGGVGDFAAPLRDDYARLRDDYARQEALRDPKNALHNFKWIRSYLTSDYSSSLGFKTEFKGSLSEPGVVYLKLESNIKNSTPRLESRQDAIFYIGISGMKDNPAILEVYTRYSSLDGIEVQTKTLSFMNKYQEKITTNQFEKKFKVESQEDGGKTTYFIKKERSRVDVSEYLNDYFSTITQYLKDAIKVHKDASNSNSRIAPTTRRSEEGITNHLKVEKMIDDLTTKKPLGHCIARALQLLKTEPFQNEPGISQICNATFADNKRTGVVKRGAPLSDSPGLFALANLFYDTIMIGSEQLTIGKNSMEQYVAFMKTLSKQYEADDTSTEYQKSGLSGIRDKRDEKLCGNNKEDIRLTLDTTNKVYDIVKSMFQAQVKHAAECLKIINRLFNITYDKTKPISIKLHDNLISKGFPELESINRDARELLIQYYTNCENKYIQGMTLVLNEQKAKKEAANAATKAKANANAAAKAKVDAALRAEAQRKIETQQLAAENKLADAKKEQARIIAAQQATQAERQDAYRAKKAEEQRVEQERRARMEALAAKRIQEQQEQEQRTAQKRAENERIIRQRMELNERARQRADEAAAAYQRARQL